MIRLGLGPLNALPAAVSGAADAVDGLRSLPELSTATPPE